MAAFSSHATRHRDLCRLSRSKSCSSLCAASSDMRTWSLSRKKLAMEYTTFQEEFPLETLKDRARRFETDFRLVGVRQREEDERGEVAAQLKRQQKRQEIERARRAVLRAAVKEKAQKEQVRVWRAEVDRVRKMEEKRARDEKEAKDEEERIWNAVCDQETERRKPVSCETCNGSGVCPACDGVGTLEATFLATRPGAAAQDLEFGIKRRGCDSCQGWNQGIHGDIVPGNGVCVVCQGVGKFCTGHCSCRRPSRTTVRALGCAVFDSPSTSPPDSPKSGWSASAWSSPKAKTSTTPFELDSPKSRKGRNFAEDKGIIKICPVCRGSLLPTLIEAQARWFADAFSESF